MTDYFTKKDAEEKVKEDLQQHLKKNKKRLKVSLALTRGAKISNEKTVDILNN